jgi:hypothetical protein
MVLSIHERAVLRPIPAHAGAVTGIMVLSDGRTLVTAGEDGMVRFHHLPLMSFPAGLPDMVAAESGETAAGRGPDRRQRTFLRALITARFHGEIGVCPPVDVAGSYDIQIAG